MDAATEREACDPIVVAKLAVPMDDANLLVPDAAIAVGANRILMVGAAHHVFARYRSHVRIGAEEAQRSAQAVALRLWRRTGHAPKALVA